MRSTFLFLSLTLSACSSSSEPPALGPLKSAVVFGRTQSSTAGQSMPQPSIDEVYRNPLTGKVIRRPNAIEKIVLPAYAYAQSVVRNKVPGAVVCVGEEQHELVPVQRCITSDALGQSRFDWLPTTTAGIHKALINASVGIEVTEPDTVTIEVKPDVADAYFRTGVHILQCSPAAVDADAVRDRFGNGVPFRIVSDGRIVVQDTAIGTVAARTVTFDEKLYDNVQPHVVELRGDHDVLVGYLQYQVYGSSGKCSPNTAYFNWTSKGALAEGW